MNTRPTVMLYRRAGCELCDHARELLDTLADEMDFGVQEVDIESDDALLKAYVFEIPVVAVGDEVVATAPIRERPLRARLDEVLATKERESRR